MSGLDEEQMLLTRLDVAASHGRSVIGVVVAARREAAARLAKRGLVVTQEGSGKDEGVLLVRKVVRSGGGSAA